MILPFNFAPLSATWSYKTNNKTDNNMPGQQPHVSTVTIPLSEYNEMRESLDMLHNALEDNKILIRDTPYSRSYMTCQTFTRDAALNKLAEKYYKLEERYKELQQNHEALAGKVNELTSTRWYMLGKWLSKCILLRK